MYLYFSLVTKIELYILTWNVNNIKFDKKYLFRNLIQYYNYIKIKILNNLKKT